MVVEAVGVETRFEVGEEFVVEGCCARTEMEVVVGGVTGVGGVVRGDGIAGVVGWVGGVGVGSVDSVGGRGSLYVF